MNLDTCDWQLQKEKLSERGKHILQSGLWSDCKFIVGVEPNKREFKAHKLFLSMASPVFDTMFHNGFQEKDNDIHILDIQPEAFATMLSYIYTDELKLHSFDQACELCYVANKYMMPFLVKHCTSYIWKDVNFSSVCRAYEFAKLFDQNQLIEKCKQIICTETLDILKHRNFLDVEFSTLSMILDQDELCISSEMDLFRAITAWVNCEAQRRGFCPNEDAEERRRIAEPLVKKVRFLAMTPAEFAEGPGSSELLTRDQSFAILMNVSSATVAGCPMPEGFCMLTVPRTLHLLETLPARPHIVKLDLTRLHPIQNQGVLESSLTFHTNKDIKLHGVQVSGQLYVPNGPILNSAFPGPTGEGPLRYQESVTVTLEDDVGSKLETAHSQVDYTEYNSPVEVSFGVGGVRVGKCRRHKLVVTLCQAGWYMCGALIQNPLVHRSVMFTFHQDERSSESTSFIYGLIFSH